MKPNFFDAGTVTFISGCGRFQFTVTKSYPYSNSGPDHTVYDHMAKYKMNNYLHNPSGPALINLQTQHVEFWLKGKKATEEEVYHFKFFDKVNAMLNED